MSLPKIDYPSYTIKIPSLGKSVKFRPFLVKEEKLLLMAKQSENDNDILSAVRQVVNNCAIDSNFDIDKIAIFDLEYIFLKLRAFSIDNIVKVSYKDYEDEKIYDFQIDLNQIDIKVPKGIDNTVKISEKSGILMKYPSSKLYEDKDFLNLEKDYMFELLVRCIDKIYLEDEVFDPSNYSRDEISEFLENLNVKAFEDMQKFLLTVPKMEHKIKYKNSLGNDRQITLNSLNDFFTFR